MVVGTVAAAVAPCVVCWQGLEGIAAWAGESRQGRGAAAVQLTSGVRA